MEKPSFYHGSLMVPPWFSHGSSMLPSVNQSIRPFHWRCCCRNGIVLLKQLLNKWPWCATCRTGRLNMSGSHWEPQTDLCTGPWPGSTCTRDPLRKCLTSFWTCTRQIISKLTIQGQKLKAEHFALFIFTICAPLRLFLTNQTFSLKCLMFSKTIIANYLILKHF